MNRIIYPLAYFTNVSVIVHNIICNKELEVNSIFVVYTFRAEEQVNRSVNIMTFNCPKNFKHFVQNSSSVGMLKSYVNTI